MRGLLRGTIGQFFSLAGLVAGLWGGGCVAHWLSLRWQDARPALVLGTLRWMVAAFSGIVIATLIAAASAHNFDAPGAWTLVAVVASAYMVARGLAKSGSRHVDSDR